VDLRLLDDHIRGIQDSLSEESSEEGGEDSQILHDAYTALRHRLNERRSSMFRDPGGRRRPTVAAMGLRKQLAGCRSVTVAIAQLFRISDLLMDPDGVRAVKLHETINTVGRLRRVLSGRDIDLGELGKLSPVANVDDQYNSFWRSGIRDVRKETGEPPLTLVPFELAPLPRIAGMRVAPEKWLSELIRDSVEPMDLGVKVPSVDGRLRIYSTGIGVIRLTVSMEFRNDVEVELLAAVIRKVESLVCVSASNEETAFEGLFADVVNEVARALFNDPGDHDRRWRPPDTIIRFHQMEFLPEQHTRELAYLMSLSPGNSERVPGLRKRVEAKLRSKHWSIDGVFGLPSHRVVLLIRKAGADESERRYRNRLIEHFIETHELVTTGIHTRLLYAEDFANIREAGGPDAEWLPGTPNFNDLSRLATATWRAAKAVASIPRHLQKTGEGPLMAYARELWRANAPEQLRHETTHVAQWIRNSGWDAHPQMAALAARLAQIEAVIVPFGEEPAAPAQADPEQDRYDNDIMDGLERIDELLESETVDFQELDAQILRVELARRNLLGA
jgi:hypothetical protein